MKVLVTGGTGFIGSHLCDALIGKGHDVIAVDDLSLGKESNIAHLKSNKNFKFIKLDVAQPDQIKQVFEQNKIDTVFHLAANSDISQSRDNPEIDFKKTFLTTYSVLDQMRLHNVKSIFFASTSAIYGDANTALDENHGPLFPVSHYGAAKLSSEAFISSFSENYNMTAWIARFPNVVGSHATHGAIYDFIKKLRKTPSELTVLGDGTQAKPYLHVSDLIDAIIYIWKNSKEKINYYNIGVTTHTTVKEMAELVVKKVSPGAEIKYAGGNRGWVGDVPKFEYDISKILALGWKSKLSSTEAIKKAIDEISLEIQ